jgi:hypothetical protein
MPRTVTAVPSFESFTNFLKRGAPQPLVKGVVKAQMNPLQVTESTHVIISHEGRRKQAAEAFTARIPYDFDI